MPRLLLPAFLLLLAPSAFAQEPLVLKDLPGWVGAIAFAPDNTHLAIGTSNGGISLWDAVTGKKRLDLEGHADAVAALAFSPDGQWLASGGYDQRIMVHALDKGISKVLTRRIFKGHNGAVLALAFDKDGQLHSGGIDGAIRRWPADLIPVRVPDSLSEHTSWVNSLAFDRAGNWFASASSDNTIHLVELPRRPKGKHVLHATEGEIRAVAFAPEGKHVAAGIRYGTVRVWDVATRKEAASFKAHAGETWAVAFTPDGKTLASVGGDWNKPSQVRLWDVGTWKEKAPLELSGEGLCLAISADGSRLAAGSWDRSVRIWKMTGK